MGTSQAAAGRRLDALADTIAAQAAARANRQTIGQLPNGPEIARQFAAMLAGDELATIKAGALLIATQGGDNRGTLEYLAQREEEQADPAFWEAIGGRPALPGDASYWPPGVRTAEEAGCPPEWWAAMDAIAPKTAGPRTTGGIDLDSLPDWDTRDAVVRSAEITKRAADRQGDEAPRRLSATAG